MRARTRCAPLAPTARSQPAENWLHACPAFECRRSIYWVGVAPGRGKGQSATSGRVADQVFSELARLEEVHAIEVDTDRDRLTRGETGMRVDVGDDVLVARRREEHVHLVAEGFDHADLHRQNIAGSGSCLCPSVMHR